MELGNKTAELKLLACILSDNSILDDVAAKIKVDDFYSQVNRVVYAEMLKLAKAGKVIDYITLFDAIKLAGKENDIGGLGFIMNLQVPTAANFASYIDIVKREAVKKDVMIAIRKINEMAKTCDDTNELMQQSQKLLQDIDNGSAKGGIDDAGSVAMQVIDDLYARSDLDCTGVKTGYTLLDKKLDGLHESELIILAARTAMGKTAFALNIALNVAKEKTVLFFSLEMSKNELVKRLLSLETGLSGESLRHPTRLPQNLQQRIWQAGDNLSKCKLEISDDASQTIADIKTTIRQTKAKRKGLDLIIVDYLTLIKSADKSANRENEVAEISRNLKMLAKEYRVPVIALAQVNRAAESRAEKKPTLADLRESGAIEQDADVVMFLYRDEYYNPKSEKQGQADLIIAKHRAGELGEIPLYFDKKLTKFGNLERADWSSMEYKK